MCLTSSHNAHRNQSARWTPYVIDFLSIKLFLRGIYEKFQVVCVLVTLEKEISMVRVILFVTIAFKWHPRVCFHFRPLLDTGRLLVKFLFYFRNFLQQSFLSEIIILVGILLLTLCYVTLLLCFLKKEF